MRGCEKLLLNHVEFKVGVAGSNSFYIIDGTMGNAAAKLPEDLVINFRIQTK